MFTIAKTFEFSASHQLAGLPPDHQCSRLHGHNYTVDVELSSDVLNDAGMVLDYGELGRVKEWINDTLDHRHLNDLVSFNPTAELLAEWLHGRFDTLLGQEGIEFPIAAVRVHETAKTVAEYRP